MSCPVLELAHQLIKRHSLSPNDAGCQKIITDRLNMLNFKIEPMPFGKTLNFWAWHGTGHTLAFAGHTDVVSPGNINDWDNPPFKPTIRNGLLYGRGAADMKGALAAMVVAAERFITQYPYHRGRLAFLITSDEETTAQDGIAKVIETLITRKEQIDYCIVGEPSSDFQLGDVIKNGRRGSLTGSLCIQGVQGHIAYPDLIINPIHIAITILNELLKTKWDDGNDFFPPTTIQIANIYAKNYNINIIPGELKTEFNFRFNNELTEETIRHRVETLIKRHTFRYHVDWWLSGHPFLTTHGKLIDTVIHVIKHYQEITPFLKTTGGTSDGRFIARLGAQIVELGPVNNTIHKINEHVKAADLQLLSRMYQRIMEQLIL